MFYVWGEARYWRPVLINTTNAGPLTTHDLRDARERKLLQPDIPIRVYAQYDKDGFCFFDLSFTSFELGSSANATVKRQHESWPHISEWLDTRGWNLFSPCQTSSKGSIAKLMLFEVTVQRGWGVHAERLAFLTGNIPCEVQLLVNLSEFAFTSFFLQSSEASTFLKSRSVHSFCVTSCGVGGQVPEEGGEETGGNSNSKEASSHAFWSSEFDTEDNRRRANKSGSWSIELWSPHSRSITYLGK